MGEQIHDKHILARLKEYDHALPLIYLILKITKSVTPFKEFTNQDWRPIYQTHVPKPTTPVNHCRFKQWRKLTSFSLSLSLCVCLSVCLCLGVFRCLSFFLSVSVCLSLSLSLSVSLSHCLPVSVSVFPIRACASLSLSPSPLPPPSLPNFHFEFCCCCCCCVVQTAFLRRGRADMGFYESIDIKNICYINFFNFIISIFAPRRIRI